VLNTICQNEKYAPRAINAQLQSTAIGVIKCITEKFVMFVPGAERKIRKFLLGIRPGIGKSRNVKNAASNLSSQ
jgi:hypothetical protein